MRRLDVGANALVILDPRLALEARAGIDGPRSHGRDRLGDVLGAEPAGEHDATFGGACAGEVRRIGLLPGEVDDAGDLAPCPQEHGVPAPHLPVLERIELDEICALVARLADRHLHREHRRRNLEDRGRAPRAPFGKDEPGHVRTGVGRDGDVLVARETAHLHERAAQELGQLRGRIGSPHERTADQDRVRARQFGRRALRTRLDAALRHDNAVAGRARNEVELGVEVDLEGRQIARVDPDERSVEGRRPRELVGIVRLDESIEAEVPGGSEQPPSRCVVEVTQDQQHCIRTCFERGAQVVLRREEALREQRDARGRSRGAQIVPRACEAFVDEDRDGSRPCALVRSARGAAGSASGRRSPADGERRLTSAIPPRPGVLKRVSETSHQSDCRRENATSSSRRSPARPLSMASAASSIPSRRSAAWPAAAIAPAALSTTASRLGPGAPARISCAACAFSPGVPPTSSSGSHGSSAEIERIQDPLAHLRVFDLEHEVRPRGRELVDPVRPVDHERPAGAEHGEGVRHGPRRVRASTRRTRPPARRRGSSAARAR